MDIARGLSIGITLNYVSGRYTYDRTYEESDPGNRYTTYQYLASTDFNNFVWHSTIRSDLSGFNALFGLMYQKAGKFKIGATVRTPTTYEISETFTDDYQNTFDNGDTPIPITTEGPTNYKVVTPMVLSTGVSVRPLDWLLIAGDAEYTDWTQMEFDSDNPDLIQENRNIKNWMRDTWNLRGGTEVSIWNLGLKLRAGIEWKPSPWKNDPKEFDQTIYTAGVGVLLDESSTVNASFALGDWKTFRDNYYLGNTPASRTSELITTKTINITFTYKF